MKYWLFGFFFCLISTFSYGQNDENQNQFDSLLYFRTVEFSDFASTPTLTRAKEHKLHLKKENLPFFCHQEEKLAKKTNLWLKFRLGSQDYVDYLERKPGAHLSNTALSTQ